jgi:hypothetical protein
MNEKMWKVKMVRLLTDKVSPDVICESSFEYELPRDYSSMLESFEQIDDEYKGSILEGVNRHLIKKFADSGFFAKELISP